MTILSLDDLLTDAGRQPFLNAFARKHRWHLSVARAAEVQALLPWTRIEGLIANSLVPIDHLRIAVNGNDVPVTMYSDDRNRLRPDAVQGFATQGATVIINDIGALESAIGDFTTVLERELRCHIQVNCYISFGAMSAFTPHHDGHDVLILQIQGAKRWRSFGSPAAFPLTGGRPAVDWQPEWEGQMTPGDLLYLPRGEVHAAIPETRPSVHLTIGITEATGVDFLQWLALKAKSVEVLRRDLGATLDGEARVMRDQGIRVALSELVDRASIAEFFADRDCERALRSVASLGAGRGGFRPETCLISALRRRLDLAKDEPGEIQLILGKRKILVSALSRHILAAVTQHNRITVATLARCLDREADDPELTAALEDLAGKSLIAVVA